MRRLTRVTVAVAVLAGVVTMALVFGEGCRSSQQSQAAKAQQEHGKKITLRAAGVPEIAGTDVNSLALQEIMAEFQKRRPDILPVSLTGLNIPGRGDDMRTLMQIAGDIPPDVMYVNFRQSHTYVSNKFLYPLERYIEKTIGLPEDSIADAATKGPQEYLAALSEAARKHGKTAEFEQEIKDRIPDQCWQVMRRDCPYGEECPHLEEWKLPQVKGTHYHTWCFPQEPVVMALFYRKDLFAEAGLPDRPPADFEELLDWSKKLTNPKEDRYGIEMLPTELAWSTLSILYSDGGLLVDKDKDGNWNCVFDTPQAVSAYYNVARLFLEPFKNDAGDFKGVVYLGTGAAAGGEIKSAMKFEYLNARFFAQNNPEQWGFGAVPKGVKGMRGSEFNSSMHGIYAGLDQDPVKRDAAWEYIRFFNGPEANAIRARVFVENGQAQFVPIKLLERAGFPEYITPRHREWNDIYQEALEGGIPEPYGRNCQQVYRYASQVIGQVRGDPKIEALIASAAKGDAAAEARAKEMIKGYLEQGVARANEKMLQILSDKPVTLLGIQLFENERAMRNFVAASVAVAIMIIFALVFWKVSKVFSQVSGPIVGKDKGVWQFGKYKWAYILMLPALASIGLWAYYPLARGTVIAFQDYNVRGFSTWVGMSNFADVLFADEFWHAMWISLKYSFYTMIFGFTAPIVLAFLLTEVPKGKLVYRTIYYLPAVLTGVIVIFLWKGFYGANGMINQMLNFGIVAINYLFSWAMTTPIKELATNWLDNKQFALFFCLLPTIWAGMGPGCLIYLAALKTVPEEIYEAADIDGAGILQKMTHVAIPSIKALVLINFIGVMIGAMKAGGGFILAMTGGGPYTPHGETEVIGLHIFYQAYGYLRLGPATAMAWVLGSMLIGFTVYRLQQLSRMEFRTAGR